jgi:DNA-binding PadR family transcriptional regulator
VVRSVVCVDEEALIELVGELLKIAKRLKPVLVAEVVEQPTVQASAPATTATAPATATEVSATIKEMILGVVKPGEKYTASRVAELIREKYGVEVNVASVSAALREMFRRGVLSRVERGVYELASGVERGARELAKGRRTKTSSKQLLLSVLERGKTYTPMQIKRLLRDRGVEIPDGTLYSALYRLVEDGKLEKTKRGSYRLA